MGAAFPPPAPPDRVPNLYDYPPTPSSWRRLVARLEATERIVLVNREWLMQMGVDEMSTLERRELPRVVSDHINERRAEVVKERSNSYRVAVLGVVLIAAQLVIPLLYHLIGVH